MAKRRAVNARFDADFSEAGFRLGAISGVEKTVTTKAYSTDVVEWAFVEMRDEFNNFMDLLRANEIGKVGQKYHHVYDWNTVGGKGPGGGRLWKAVLTGRGAKNRVAAFVWKASLKPIPSAMDRYHDSNDPMSLVPLETVERLSDRTYFFYNKAPVMEYNRKVSITPVNAKRLFIPTGDPENPFTFAVQAVNFEPGGTATTMSFTTAWIGWWTTAAPGVFNDRIQSVVENQLSSAANVRYSGRARSKTMGIGVRNSINAAYEEGEDYAEQYLKRHSRRGLGRLIEE